MDVVNGVVVPGRRHARPAAGAAAAAAKAGVDLRYRAPVERILLAAGSTGAVRGRAAGRRRGDPGRRGRVQRRPAGRLPHAAAGPAGAPGGPRRAATRRRPSSGTWASGASCRRAPPTTTSTSAGRGTGPSGRCCATAGACPSPSLLVSVPTVERPGAGPRRPSRPLRARAGAEPRRPGRLDDRDGPGPATTWPPPWRLGYPTDIEVEELVDPARLGGPRHGAGHAVRPGAHVPPDRPVPAAATCTAARRAWCSPGRARCRASGVPMVLVSGMLAAQRVARCCRERPRRRSTGPVTLDESYRLCRQLNRRYGTTYYWSSLVLPGWSATTCGRSTPSAATPTTSSTTWATLRSRRGEKALTDLRRPVLRRPRRRAVRPPVLRAVVHTVRAYGHDPEVFRRFLASMAMDLSIDRYATWDDLLVYMDGSAAVIGEMMLPILEPRDPAAASARPATSASPSSSPTSSATWPRTSTAGGSTSRSRTSALRRRPRPPARRRPSGGR